MFSFEILTFDCQVYGLKSSPHWSQKCLISHCLDVCVDVAKNELHILTMDCSITGSLLFLFKDDGVCQEAAEMPRDILFLLYRTG